MKRYFVIFVIILLAGCSFKKTQSITYKIITGDTIKIILKTNGGYSIEDAKQRNVIDHYGSFKITKLGDKMASGYFEEESLFNYYYNSNIESSVAYTGQIGKSKKEERIDAKIICYQFIQRNENYCYILPKNTKTTIAIYNNDNFDDLVDIIDRLTFIKK